MRRSKKSLAFLAPHFSSHLRLTHASPTPNRFLDDCNTQLQTISEKAYSCEDFLIGNPDEMSLGDLSELCSVMHDSNSNMLTRVEVILRQYGYKGPSCAPSSALVRVPDPAPPAVVEHDDDEIDEIAPGPEVRQTDGWIT